MVQKCAEHSQEALIVKIADVYDNFVYYQREKNESEIERCRVFAHLIRKYKKTDYDHEIFILLDKIIL